MTAKEYFSFLYKCFFKLHSLRKISFDKNRLNSIFKWLFINYIICIFFTHLLFFIRFNHLIYNNNILLIIFLSISPFWLYFRERTIVSLSQMPALLLVLTSVNYFVVSLAFKTIDDYNIIFAHIILGISYGFVAVSFRNRNMTVFFIMIFAILFLFFMILEYFSIGKFKSSLVFFSFIITTGRFYYYFINPIYNKNNPLIWDENIGITVPNLSQLLKNYAKNKDFDKTIEFTNFLIEERPVQRIAAQKGLIFIALDKLLNITNINKIINLRKELDFLPSFELLADEKENDVPTFLGIKLRKRFYGFNSEITKFYEISGDLQKTEEELNYANRVRVYEKTQKRLEDLRKSYLLSSNPFAKEFSEVAKAWHSVLTKTIDELRQSGKLPLPNPYITGKPTSEDSEVFMGRRDIIQKIETETLRDGDPATILFHGNRRTGKSSTLLNLQPLVQSSLLTIYVDMQNAEYNTDTRTFCESLTAEIVAKLKIKDKPKVENLAHLTRFLQSIDAQMTAENRHLLICLDEYERIEKCIAQGRLVELPDALRHWIQHLRKVVFLLAGSNEPSELKGIDWTDYLINVRNVPISYLDEAAALQLVTRPVSHFDLTWQPDNLPQTLIARLGRQPYLIQCTMWNLIEALNTAGRKYATPEDVNQAIQKMLDHDAKNHFDHFWGTEMDDNLRKMLLELAKNKQPTEGVALNRLKRKEVVKKEGDVYVFCVPVLQEWILQNTE